MKTVTKPKIKSLNLSCTPKGDRTLLKLTLSHDETGIVYKMTSVLLVYGWDIIEAVAETSEEGFVQDIFLIQNHKNVPMSDELLMKIKDDLEHLFLKDIEVEEYLTNSQYKLPDSHSEEDSSASIRLYNTQSDYTVMDVIMEDRPGILFQITQILFLSQMDILSFTANTMGGKIRDSFLIRSVAGHRLSETEDFPILKNKLLKAL